MFAIANILFKNKGEIHMISYEPLRKTLKERNLNISDLRNDHGGFLSTSTVTKLSKDSDIKLSMIDKICSKLDVPIEKVVKITK
jgi:DNA-binding Xre family transcriptional regulator